MKKIVINNDYGGFGLSYAAVLRYCELKAIEVWAEQDKGSVWKDSWTYWLVSPDAERSLLGGVGFYELSPSERAENNRRLDTQVLCPRRIPRDDLALVQTVEELGAEASGQCASLKVVEIPEDVAWEIKEYDGLEHVAEVHRTWR